MSSGKTHDRLTLWSLPWLTGITWYLTKQEAITLIIAMAFLFSGLMFGPDLDIYSVQYQRWGKLGFLWHPYQKWCKHRSIWSHGIIIGTSFRLIYLFTIVLVVAMVAVGIAQIIWGFDWHWQEKAKILIQQVKGEHRTRFLALYLGLELGAISHILADHVSSWQKRRPKRVKKRIIRRSVKKK